MQHVLLHLASKLQLSCSKPELPQWIQQHVRTSKYVYNGRTYIVVCSSNFKLMSTSDNNSHTLSFSKLWHFNLQIKHRVCIILQLGNHVHIMYFVSAIVPLQNTLSVLFLVLVHDTSVQQKIRTEMADLSSGVTVDDVTNMPYTSASILELKRFHTPLPISARHCNRTGEAKFGDYTIPKDTEVSLTQGMVDLRYVLSQ